MAHVIPENVQETSTTTGTGTLTLLGAVTGALDFDSQMGTSDTCPYCMDDGTDLEVGYGTFTSPATLARDTVIYSTNGGAAVNWGSGTRNVIGGLPGTDLASLLDPADGVGFLARTAARTYAARTLTVSRGLTMINPTGVGGDPEIGGAFKSIREFGAVTGVGGAATNNTAFAAAITYLNSVANPAAVVFEEGIWEYSTDINWADVPDHSQILGIGLCRLRYTGTGNAFILDGGAAGAGTFDLRIGPFLIEAPSTADHGVYMRAVHHSILDLNVRGCGSTSAGIKLEWCVLNEIKYRCSSNQEGGAGFYTSAQPLYGIHVADRSASASAYNTWINPIVEGCDEGIWLEYCIGEQFRSGTSEGHDTIGLTIDSTANLNYIDGMDFEANAGGNPSGLDIEVKGSQNVLNAVASDSLIRFYSGANYNTSHQCRYFNIQVDSGANLTQFSMCTYDRQGVNVGTFTDNGTNTIARDLVATRTGTVEASGRATYDLLTWSTESPSGTNHIYTCSGKPVIAVVSGGLITQFIYGRSGGGGNFVAMPIAAADGAWPLNPGDSINVTYTAGFAPAIYIWDT